MSDIDQEEEEILDEPAPAPRPPKKKDKPPGPLESAKGRAPTPTGAGFVRQGVNEADLIWTQICEWLPTSNDPALPTRSPYDVSIQVRRSWPPHPSGLAQPMGQGISGSSVAGSEGVLPGVSLINFITKYIHLPTTDQPASYDVYFFKKSTGGTLTSGRLPLPSGPECRAALAAAERSQSEGGPMPGPGLGSPGVGSDRRPAPAPDSFAVAPPMGWNPMMMPPGYGGGYGGYPGFPGGGFGGFPGGGFGAPPPPPQPASLDAATMGELAYLRGALSEALAAAKEQRPPVIAPPPPAPPTVAAPPRLSDEELVERVAGRVLAGLKGAPPQPAGAPITTAAGLSGMAEKLIGTLIETSMRTAFAGVEKNIKRGLGMGAPPDGSGGYADEGPEEPAAPPPDPKDAVPWDIAPVGATWGNGAPVQVALDKETGGLSPMGLAFANPVVAEKVITIAEGLGQAIQQAIRRIGETPAGTGVGRPANGQAAPAAMQPMMGPAPLPAPAAPPAPAPAAPQPAAPPPAPSGGWGAPPT